MEDTTIICQSCGEVNAEDTHECMLCGNSFRWIIRERRHLKVCAAWRQQADESKAKLALLTNENTVFRQALQRIATYPIHSDPGNAGCITDIAFTALKM